MGRRTDSKAVNMISKDTSPYIDNSTYPKSWYSVRATRTNFSLRRRGYRGGITAKQVLDIWERQGRKCNICKTVDLPCERMHMDHIIPISKGGSACDTDNLQLLCNDCSTQKTMRDKRGIGFKRSKTTKYIKVRIFDTYIQIVGEGIKVCGHSIEGTLCDFASQLVAHIKLPWSN